MRFDPSGELDAVSVRDGAATLPVPPDARRTTLWFEATSATGCHAWDSDYGADYVFEAATPPQWVGDAGTLLTRDTGGDICGGAPASTGFAFDTWVRERAAITNLCFQVYQPGVTDRDDPELWQKLDVGLRWRGAGATAWQAAPVSFDRRVGNNARYAVSWRDFDPFRAYHCPDVATSPASDGYVQAALDYVVVVNGAELRPAPGAAFSATFIDYADNSWRSANCP